MPTNARSSTSLVIPSPASSWLPILLLGAAVYGPFVFHGGFGEWDSYRMALGLLRASLDNVPAHEAAIYNHRISFGYSYLILLFRHLIVGDPFWLTTVMNAISGISAVVGAALLARLVHRIWGHGAAVASGIVLLMMPMYHYTGLYGHPMTLACALFLAAVNLILPQASDAYRSDRFAPAIWSTSICVVLLALSLSVRLDAILLFPMLTGVLLCGGRPYRTGVLLSLAIAVLALVVYAVLRTFALPPNIGSATEIAARLFEYHNLTRLVHESRIGFASFVFAVGPLCLCAFILAVLVVSFRRDWRTLSLLLPVSALNLAFWLPSALPVRHFLYAGPAMSIGIGVLFTQRHQLQRLRQLTRRPALAATTLCLAGMLLAETLFPVVRSAYPWKGAPQNFSWRVPIRSVPMSAFLANRYFDEAARIADEILELPRPEAPTLVVADAYPVAYRLKQLEPTSRVWQSGWHISVNLPEATAEYLLVFPTDLHHLTESDEYLGHRLYLDKANTSIPVTPKLRAQFERRFDVLDLRAM